MAGFGTLATRIESVLYADDRARGVVHAAALVGGTVALGVVAERVARNRPVTRTLLTAVATWSVLGGRTLEREATAVSTYLESDDLPGARQRLTRLVGRDTAQLDGSEVARAVVESVAENTSDAVVAPLLLGAVGGMPALLGYRAANTLDAMVGHRSERYRNFGWASARLDDLLNLPGSRLTAALAVVLGDDHAGAHLAWRRDAYQHPSPNAGPVEAAFAGALGIRLGGTNTYGSATEDRGHLGDGRLPEPADISRATRLATKVGCGAAVIAVSVAARPRKQPRQGS